VKEDTAVGQSLRWGLLYDICRFAGLQVFLQSLVGGSTLIFANRHDSFQDRVRALKKAQCNALSGTPTMWRRLLMIEGFQELSLRIVSLGGEIADRAILQALSNAFPEARITHIYASTEAGVGFSVSDSRPGFPSSYLENPPPGVDMKVDDEGMLYLKPQKESDQYYVEKDKSIVSDDGWIKTNDIVEREGDRYFFKGRAGGVINVGGNKVHPEEVEAVIQEVDGVAQVAVTAKRSAITGSLVEARIISSQSRPDEELKVAVQEACRSSLESYKVPATCRIVPSLEMNAAGKLDR
jgi:acyl-CoA synthetase (AMP-forming)/AMP-acid ligase II